MRPIPDRMIARNDRQGLRVTSKRKRVALRPGDVFEITTPDGACGYGVIILGGGCPYIILLRGLHRQRPLISELEEANIVLVGWTMDALFYRGDWKVIASGYPQRDDVPYPNHIVSVGTELITTDYMGNSLGNVRAHEVGLLEPKSSRAPIGFHKAFIALHGHGEWRESDAELTAEHARKRMTRHPVGTTTH